MDTSKIVGEKIKSLREDKSITIEELAQRSGLAMEQIERIENNIDIPSLAPLIKIARVLGVRLGRPCHRAVYQRLFEHLCQAHQCGYR